MKTIIKTICIVILSVLFSCGDSFLDKSDPARLNSGSFYQTEDHFKQAMNGVFHQLQLYVAGVWQYTEFISDNTTLHYNQNDRGQGPGLEALEYWQFNTTTMEQIGPYNLYNGLYSYLSNINILLSKLQDANIDEKVKLSYEAQAKFMRAFYYFDLVQFFGDVILITEPITDPDRAWDYQRSSVADVFAQIDSDVKFAVETLPLASDLARADIGRPTKGAALTLQGRTFLVRKQYNDAIASFKQVLTMGYALLPDYATVFDPVSKNHAESIFDVQFQGGNDLGEHNGFLYNFYPRESYGAVIPFPNVNGSGWNIPTLDIIGDYEPDDLRKDISLQEGYVSVRTPGVWMPIPFINKYNHPHTIQGRADNNWPLMRYAEVLLSLAEAINEQNGPTGEAYGYLNDVRTRAGLDIVDNLSKEEFRVKVLHERRIELAFENHRWFDLKRTMSPDELVTFLMDYGVREMTNPTTPTRAASPFTSGDYVITKDKLLFPIPAREMRLNPELKQNPGYN